MVFAFPLSKPLGTSFQRIWGANLTGIREIQMNWGARAFRLSLLPLMPRLATYPGLVRVSAGAGFKPVATLATSFKKVKEIEEYRENFSDLGGKGGNPGYCAHGVLCALPKAITERAPNRVKNTVKGNKQ